MESVIVEVKPLSPKPNTITFSYDPSENLNEIAIHIKMPNDYKYHRPSVITQKKPYNSFFDNTNKE